MVTCRLTTDQNFKAVKHLNWQKVCLTPLANLVFQSYKHADHQEDPAAWLIIPPGVMKDCPSTNLHVLVKQEIGGMKCWHSERPCSLIDHFLECAKSWFNNCATQPWDFQWFPMWVHVVRHHIKCSWVTCSQSSTMHRFHLSFAKESNFWLWLFHG